MKVLMRLASSLPNVDRGFEALGAAACVRLAQECINTRDISIARYLEQHLIRQQLLQQQQPFLGNLLIRMYAKCGSLAEARRVLYKMLVKDVVSWTSLICGYSDQGDFEQALNLFHRMQQEGFHPNAHTFGSILKACSSCIQAGRQIHEVLVLGSRLYQSDVFVSTALLSMYGSCGRIAEAREVFLAMTHRNVVTWSAMLNAYVVAIERSERSASKLRDDALQLFRALQNEGCVRPDKVMFISVLGICSDLTQGIVFHRCVLEAGLGSDCAICHALIVMFARCGSFEQAEVVFRSMVSRDVIAWTSIIKAAAGADESLLLFRQMLAEGVVPNSLTLAEALNSCSEAAPGNLALSAGKCIHACMLELGVEKDVILGTALINMYAKCEALSHAEEIFELMLRKNLVSWTAMITAYAETNRSEQAILLYRRMQLEGLTPNRVSFISILTAYSTPEFLRDGRLTHAFIAEEGLETESMVANAVISMYGRCGSVEDARKVFEGISRPDTVSWSALLAAYAQAGSLDNRRKSEEALLLFRRMQLEGFTPKKVTLVSLLSCCTDLSAGKLVHSRIQAQGLQCHLVGDSVLGNAIVNMYARCGALEIAEREFRKLQARDIVSWNGMITASAQHGLGSEAVEFFQEMQQEGIKPDEITMVSLIFACSHGGNVEEGCGYFASISSDHGLFPQVEHYACLLDMLGRAGHLEEAEEFVRGTSVAFDRVLLTTLLSSCRVHGDVERAKAASGRILDVDTRSSSAYVMLSQLYTHS